MKNTSHQKFINFIDAYIILSAFFLIIFMEALFSIFELFTYGIFKKEILTERSNLGFDIKIKM
tara:strand:+ start:573 stop:761 length:189 start_codon:yes stop_codon:yes gene_type:complete